MSFNDLMKNAGVELPEELSKKLEKKVESFYYTHKEGEYMGLFSRLNFHYRDADSKKCEADKPGAKLFGASIRIIILKDPDGEVVNGGKFIEDVELGRLTYTSFVSLKAEDQWKNAKTFANFTNDIEEANIVQLGGTVIKLNNLPLFVGCPVIFKIVAGKKEGSRFLNDLSSYDKTAFTNELIETRKKQVEVFETELEKRLEIEKAKREAKKGEASAAEETVEVEDDYMEDMI